MAGLVTPLFCPTNADEPHPALMHEFIAIFIGQLRDRYPFVSPDVVTSCYLRSTLSPPLANAIAALATPLAGSVQAMRSRDLDAASTAYWDAAKKSLVGPAGAPSISTIEACIIIAEREREAQRWQEYDIYGKRALVIAQLFKLDKEEILARPDLLLPEQHPYLPALRVALFRLLQDLKARIGAPSSSS